MNNTIDDETANYGICPLCSAPVVIFESSNGNGGISVDYMFDSTWLGDPGVLFTEQGSEDPNTYHGM